MLIAFMPWCGYNYEDSVLISERVVKEDIYTSVHIEEFEVVARDTKLGPEEITRDIPNVGEEMLRNLDESGIIRIGAPVKPEDILVGKITPKGETQLTPEEKLLRAIFGDKARDVKNTSLKVPPGVEGTVIDVKVFNRRSGEKDERTRNIEDYEISRLDAKEQDHIRAITRRMRERLLPIVDGKQIATTLLGDKKGEVLAEAGAAMTEELLMALPVKKLADLFQSKEVNENVGELLVQYDHQIEYIKSIYDSKREKVTEGDDLPPGVIKMVKVHIAIKRKLSVGDKMAAVTEQGCRLPHSAGRGHALLRRRPPRGHRAEPPRRAFPYEHRPDRWSTPAGWPPANWAASSRKWSTRAPPSSPCATK